MKSNHFLQDSIKKNPRKSFGRRKRERISIKISKSMVTSLNLQRVEVNFPRIKGRNLIRKYNALTMISMDIMLLNFGSIKIKRERTKNKKQVLLTKMQILILIWSC